MLLLTGVPKIILKYSNVLKMHLMISKTSTVTPFLFAFLKKVDHYLSARQF